MRIYLWEIKTGLGSLDAHIVATKSPGMTEAINSFDKWFEKEHAKALYIDSVKYLKSVEVID
jgi:hypothetical protein